MSPDAADRPHWRSRSLAVALGVAGGLLTAELCLRALLFSAIPPFARLGASLRQPDHYAIPTEHDLWWLLRFTWSGDARDSAPGWHPRYGWSSHLFDGESLEHRERGKVGQRRAIALTGDSFSLCLTEREDCFEGLLDDLPTRRFGRLLNYGVGGFGFDQTHRLTCDLLDSAQERAVLGESSPVVVIGLIPDDVDRMAVGVRDFVKPRYERRPNGWAYVAPATPSTSEYLAEHGFGVRSWLWRHAVYASRLGHSIRRARRARHRSETGALFEHLAGDLHRRLEAQGLEHFFLVMPDRGCLEAGFADWQEELLARLAAEEGFRVLDARRDLEADMLAHDRTPSDYYGGAGAPLHGHFNLLGNSLATLALLRGLAGEADAGEPIEGAGPLAELAREALAEQRARIANLEPTSGIGR